MPAKWASMCCSTLPEPPPLDTKPNRNTVIAKSEASHAPSLDPLETTNAGFLSGCGRDRSDLVCDPKIVIFEHEYEEVARIGFGSIFGVDLIEDVREILKAADAMAWWNLPFAT